MITFFFSKNKKRGNPKQISKSETSKAKQYIDILSKRPRRYILSNFYDSAEKSNFGPSIKIANITPIFEK